MAGHPTAPDLLAAVAKFLADLPPELAGQSAFHAKVAANALAIVQRELALGPDAAEAAALAPFADVDGPVGAMRAAVCERLRSGALSPTTPRLKEALMAATLARLAVDNPRYSTFIRLSPSES